MIISEIKKKLLKLNKIKTNALGQGQNSKCQTYLFSKIMEKMGKEGGKRYLSLGTLSK